MFGVYTNSDTFPDLSESLKTQLCPWSKGKRCYKTRKSDPDTAIGTCSLCFDNIEQPILICPTRLLDGNKIFIDCLPFISSSITGSELYLVPEVKTSCGRIDFVLVAARNNVPIDFVPIELQTLDTTGSIWNDRQSMLIEHGYTDENGNARGGVSLNWRMTAKTILAQLVQKSQLFAGMGKNLVLVCQTPLYEYMEANFNFSNVRKNADLRDVLHFHMYDYKRNNDAMQLSLAYERSADLNTVNGIMGLNTDSNQALHEITELLTNKLTPENRFNPFCQ